MQTRRTLIFSLLFVLLGLSLMLGGPREVNAGGSLTAAEWEEVAGYIDAYIDSQYVAGNSETGFIHTPVVFKGQIDNNGGGDGVFCGVGDDMAGRPVLVDNLSQVNTLIPGTSIRNIWNSASTTLGGMSSAVIAAVKAKVIAHKEAGFGTDISIY